MGYDHSYGTTADGERGRCEKAKPDQGGEATAEGFIIMNPAAYQTFITGIATGASDAWTVARLAGILGAKQADEHILVSHSFNIVGIEMEFETSEKEKRVTVRCQVRTSERMGAESAALVGCGLSLMSLVDTLRAIDRGLKIESLRIKRD